MTAQNLPVPFSYTQSLMASYKASRERLNSGKVRDTGVRCASASVRSGGLRSDLQPVPKIVKPDPVPLTERALAQWAARQKQRHMPVLMPIGRQRPVIPTIKRIIAKHYDVRLEDIDSVQRTMDITWPRQIMMYLSRQMTIHSLTEIGRRFGGRDHTTILHAIRKVSRRAMTDETFASELAELMMKIEGAKT